MRACTHVRRTPATHMDALAATMCAHSLLQMCTIMDIISGLCVAVHVRARFQVCMITATNHEVFGTLDTRP
jgi:hypothetical protein